MIENTVYFQNIVMTWMNIKILLDDGVKLFYVDNTNKKFQSAIYIDI